MGRMGINTEILDRLEGASAPKGRGGTPSKDNGASKKEKQPATEGGEELDIKGGMKKLGLEAVDPALFPDPKPIRWWHKEMADAARTVAAESAHCTLVTGCAGLHIIYLQGTEHPFPRINLCSAFVKPACLSKSEISMRQGTGRVPNR